VLREPGTLVETQYLDDHVPRQLELADSTACAAPTCAGSWSTSPRRSCPSWVPGSAAPRCTSFPGWMADQRQVIEHAAQQRGWANVGT
jgi:predicted component of type VI protein secretion system